MSARKRSALKCFNRRRDLILQKGSLQVLNQLDSCLGQCITHVNELEKQDHRRRCHTLLRQQAITQRHEEQRLRKYVMDMERGRSEPTLLVYRDGVKSSRPAKQFNYQEEEYGTQASLRPANVPNYVSQNWPHYRWPLGASSPAWRPSTLATVDLYCADRPKTCKLWERQPKRLGEKNLPGHPFDADNNSDQKEENLPSFSRPRRPLSSAEEQTTFHSLIQPSPPLTKSERHDLFDQWMDLRRRQHLDDESRLKLLERCKSANSSSAKEKRQIKKQSGQTSPTGESVRTRKTMTSPSGVGSCRSAESPLLDDASISVFITQMESMNSMKAENI